MLTFDRDAQDKVNQLQKRLADQLKQFNREKAEAAHVAFAMARLVRNLMDFYPDELRNTLTEQVLIPFLRHEAAEGDAGRLISLN